eukprot:7799795-Ditylum_brightwellii.AAC.2
MKPIAKGGVSGTLSSLDAPGEAITSSALYTEVIEPLNFKPPWEMLYNDNAIMQALLKWNSLHLHQAYGTLFVHGPLKNYIGEYGIGKGVKDIIHGKFDPNTSGNLPANSSNPFSEVKMKIQAPLHQEDIMDTTMLWQKAINVMLQKIPGNSSIYKLRIIVIVEGDMNGVMKVIWNKCLVPHAEEYNKLHP